MREKSYLKGGVPTLAINKPEDYAGLRMIDVRRPDEFNGELGHIEGAILKTLGPELEQFLMEADRKEPTLFICRSGVRSAKATTLAMELGFAEVYNMEGGMLDWSAKRPS